jgi:16S rRNA (guanine1207-N2)-methyltransferase
MAVQLLTRPGFPEWGHLSQASQLLAAQAQLRRGERTLVCPCGHGALGVWAAAQCGAAALTLADTNAIATAVARRTLAAAGCGAARVIEGAPGAAGTGFDVVLMTLPKGRDLARLYLLGAWQALRAGGRLYLAGANDEGIKSVIGDAEVLFGPSTMLTYKGGNRIVRLLREATAPAALPPLYGTPGLAEGTYAEFSVEHAGASYILCTRPGVFSWREVDAGTRLLLESLPVRATDQVLDVGCGSGLVGMVAARQAVKGAVTLVDVDALAVECARATLARNGIAAPVLFGDGLAAVAGQRFTLIVSNPPFHSGHAVSPDMVEALIPDAHAALERHGRLVVVANRFLPYERLMAGLFGSVTTLAETSQYRVLQAEKVYQRKQRGKPTRAQRHAQAEAGVLLVEDDGDDDW